MSNAYLYAYEDSHIDTVEEELDWLERVAKGEIDPDDDDDADFIADYYLDDAA
jgi:hypothetical protein